ncbi:lantibiotic dehydratase [Microscilla marina]|uniref:Lantibiotic dehydratase, C terminus family n=1 Tax=Microscilla marina ATCC 23134 TaxID=313606 RepID=A1ZVC6_MICM2|nr:lantibiotic dehydratase [Microscilla marina]EAY25624.1 lantibiotic dehydratase, C terminus family [Microscilla marina ATCC 23134]
MTKKNSAIIDSFGWYIIRSPLFPISNTDLAYQAHTSDDYKKLFDNDFFKEAIYLASHHLYYQFDKWLNNSREWQNKSEKEESKLIKTLLKYWLRSSYRCTPFGTMAGISKPAIFSHKTEIILSDFTKYSRIDAEYLFLSTNELTEDKSAIKFHPNTHIYNFTQERLRYFERIVKATPQGKFKYQYHLAEIDDQFYIKYVFSKFPAGATKDELTNALLEEGLNKSDVIDFIHQLIDNQVLNGTSFFSTVGQEYQEKILPRFKQGNYILQKTKQAHKLSNFLQLEKTLVKLIQKKLPKARQVFDNFFHVDTINNYSSNTIHHDIEHKVNKVIKALTLFPERKNPYLSEFKKKFQERYQSEFIPINDALDPENGILYANYALREPFILRRLPNDEKKHIQTIELNNDWNQFLMEIYSRNLLNNKRVVNLSSKQLKTRFRETPYSHIADTISANVSIISENQIYLKSLTQGAANLIGRFSHVNKQILKGIQEITTFEQESNPNSICAEIVHNPANPKSYNILNRSGQIRKYKILLSANLSYFTPDEAISLDDLLVGIIDNQITLYSKTHQKQIIPKLTSAHNYLGSNYPIYQFLCDLSQGEYLAPNWVWGTLEKVDYLPRVAIDGVIVSPEKWKLKNIEDLELLNVPKKVLLVNGDNKLLINREHKLSNEILIDSISKLSSFDKVKAHRVLLEEYIESKPIVRDGLNRHYSNEIIIPYKVHKSRVLTTPSINSPQKHHLGSKWTYFKIYCGVLTANHLIKYELSDLISKLEKSGIISKWFFIRYHDENGHHIRIRFQTIKGVQEIFDLIQKILGEYLNSSKIKVVLDTYYTETKRYGGVKTLSLCEDIFWLDSQTILKALHLLEKDDERLSIRIAMKNIECLADAFFQKTEKKQVLISRLASNMKNEFNIPQKQLSKRYKEYLELDFKSDLYDHIFQERTYKLLPILYKINEYINAGICNQTMESLFASISHMTLNRFFIEKARIQEYITYDFLNLHYKSKNKY